MKELYKCDCGRYLVFEDNLQCEMVDGEIETFCKCPNCGLEVSHLSDAMGKHIENALNAMIEFYFFKKIQDLAEEKKK